MAVTCVNALVRMRIRRLNKLKMISRRRMKMVPQFNETIEELLVETLRLLPIEAFWFEKIRF